MMTAPSSPWPRDVGQDLAHDLEGVFSWSNAADYGDKNIYLPCIGWAGLDGAVIIGAVLYG